MARVAMISIQVFEQRASRSAWLPRFNGSGDRIGPSGANVIEARLPQSPHRITTDYMIRRSVPQTLGPRRSGSLQPTAMLENRHRRDDLMAARLLI
jgi:hypothetical protein